MVPIKPIVAVVTGAGILGGATSPLIHIGVTRPNWKTKWNQRVNFSEPILKNCRPDDSPDNKKNINFRDKLYSLFIEFVEGEAGKGEVPKILFRVEETDTKTKDKKVIWGPSIKKEGAEWDTWRLGYKEGSGEKPLDFTYPYEYKWSQEIRFGRTSCEKIRIVPVPDKGFGPGVPVVSKDITLSLTPDEKCRKNFSSVECDVIINASGKLKWVDGQQPRITYTVF